MGSLPPIAGGSPARWDRACSCVTNRPTTVRGRPRRLQRFLVFAVPPPDRDPERRRPELPFTPLDEPVPDAPGRFALFFAPVEPRPEV